VWIQAFVELFVGWVVVVGVVVVVLLEFFDVTEMDGML
jgi:hypothetical protein